MAKHPRIQALLRLVTLWIVCAVAALAQTAAVELPAELVPYFNAIRLHESNNKPWSIYDNTTSRSHVLTTRLEAETLAKELINQYGHNLDLGLMQLNCRYQCKRPGVSLDNIFDPVVNVNTAKIVFLEFWQRARRVSTEFNTRIVAAVGAYNNGRVATPNLAYVEKVWGKMGKPVSEIPKDGAITDQAATGKTSILDDVMGRASKGMDWARERVAALNKPKDDAAKKKQAEKTDAAPNAGEVTQMVVGGIALLAGVALAIFLGIVLVKFLGLKGALRLGYTLFSNRNKQ
jgi:hypothetical protein